MRARARALLAFGAAATILAAGVVAGPGARSGAASNHIDAIGQITDRQLDVSDLFFFTSPNNPDTVTAICNWSAFELPVVDTLVPFYSFVTSGHYDFNFDNNGDGKPEFTYRFRFENKDGRPDPPKQKGGMPPGLDALLPKGNHSVGEALTLGSGILKEAANHRAGAQKKSQDDFLRKAQDNYLRRLRATDRAGHSGQPQAARRAFRQSYSLELLRPGHPNKVLARNVSAAPWGRDGRHNSVVSWEGDGGGKVYAGPDSDPFFWWFPTNVQTIALQLPKKLLALNNNPTANPVVGVSTLAYRESFDLLTGKKTDVQSARQGMSGFSSVALPLQMRDYYHSVSTPATDYKWKDMQDWLKTGSTGSLFGVAFLPVTGLLNIGKQLEQMFLYGMAKSTGPIKKDLNAHNLNRDAKPGEIKPSEQMRLNMMTPLAKWNRRHGVLDGDEQGYPNGRRMTDDVFTAFLRITVGEPAYFTPLGVISVIPISGVPLAPQEFPYQNPPW